MTDEVVLTINGQVVFRQDGAPANPELPPPTNPPPVNPPPTGDPALDAFDVRANQHGQWCAWKAPFWQSAAFVPLQTRLVAGGGYTMETAYVRINQQIQFYNNDFVVPGNFDGATYRYFDIRVGNFVADVGGAADSYVAWFAAQQGRTVIPPLK